ncbi:extracellular protein 59-1 [Teratosphaeria destructans]|uniref:Extracellular protein 59-1 n=1 Tax=Teratosphaeria destructans TaxID=418781 RepID=A0A9W7SLH7_9PEZI|nr:extracellular protein 59-1 [Teratosphaeria destructans]
MITKTIVTIALATLAFAAPTSLQNKRDTRYHGVSINVNAAPLGQTPVLEPAPCEINVLTSLGNNTQASELIFDRGVAVNVNLASVECRAYKDNAGLIPGSAPFTNASKAVLSTEVVTVGSILCYVTEAK